jgi:hypothetical protein
MNLKNKKLYVLFIFLAVTLCLFMFTGCKLNNPFLDTDLKDPSVPAPGPGAIAVTGVELDESSVSVAVNDSLQLAAAVLTADASNNNVTWSSSDDAIASVDQSGNVTGEAEGTATVTVTTEDGGFSDSCLVVVEDLTSFISVWDMSLTATNTLEFPLDGSGTYSFDIDWGDGNVEVYNSASVSHDYQADGIYVVTISGTCDGFGFTGAAHANKANLVDISQWGNVSFHMNSGIFQGCVNLSGFSALDTPDLSENSSFYNMLRVPQRL